VREVERSAPSVEEALEAALSELGISEQEAVVEILQEPRGGFLGVGAQEATVRVRAKAEPGLEEEPAEEALEEQGDIAADFLEELLERMGVPATVELSIEGQAAYLEVAPSENEDVGLLIGRRGQTLEALQELARTLVSRRTGERCRVVVDVEGYRRRRRSRLASQAREVAQRVKRTGREEELEPMTPFERKIVHDAIAGLGGVETVSRGEDPERRVVVRPRR
jgi:spoIIIJ-associated protein